MINKIVMRDHGNSQWLVFDEPIDVLTATTAADVRPVLADVERRSSKDGLFAAGFVNYEAASGFDASLKTQPHGQMPLLCFGLFAEPQRLAQLPTPAPTDLPSHSWQMTTSQHDYLEKFQAIKKQIELGNTYQINFTLRQIAENLDDPWHFFLGLADVAPYAAFIDTDEHAVVSTSPELFFRLQNEELICKPMKGTAARGTTFVDDQAAQHELYHSAKNRAENVMVTDMLRNDMGRVAEPGSVEVRSLFDIEKYPTVWQMTSTVTARTHASISDIFAALFPCASITGAPKASSMAIITELEDSPREIYTGTIGYFSPDRQAQFSVAIRTTWIDKKNNQATYGVGGGIVWDSDPDEEYRECISKTKVLATTAADTDFELLETLLWTKDEGYFLLELHLGRISDSAAYFDFEFDRKRIDDKLLGLQRRLIGDRHRVRLLLRRDGQVSVTEMQLPSRVENELRKIRLAAEPVNAANVFLFHKTTKRDVYEKALESVSDCDDVLLWNTDGFITEASSSNVIVEIDGELVTPPISCGLLGGTYRQWLLSQGELKERAIHVDELAKIQDLTLINSVRGRIPARLSRD